MDQSQKAPLNRAPRTNAQWDRIQEIKLEVLQQDPLDLMPDQFPEIRREVLMSWKRSMLAGVDAWGTEIPFDEGFSPTNRLARIAQPIMNRLEDQLSDLSSWGFLTDRGCRLLTSVVGDAPDIRMSQGTKLRPGLCFSEEAIGTNGIGLALEDQRPQVVSGTEHFRMDTGILTTTGVNIRDPYTRRFVGTLGVHCRREYGSGAILPLVLEIGKSIEAQLLASRADGEKVFFDHFLRLQRRSRGAVIGITKELYLVNAGAQRIVHEADEGILRRLAEEASLKSRSISVQHRLSSGDSVRVIVEPIEQARGDYAAVLLLEQGTRPFSSSAGEMRRLHSELARPDYRSQLAMALKTGKPVLVTGERGTGKQQLIMELLGESENVRVLPCLSAASDPVAWMAEFERATGTDRGRVLLCRIDELPPAIVDTVSDYVERAAVPVIATASEGFAEQGATLVLSEVFQMLVKVPPLRDRPDEFPAICRRILDELEADDGRKSTLPTKTLAHLVANDWPGNLRQLRQVLATSKIRSVGTAIHLTDLPQRYARATRQLGEMEQVERKTLMIALREAEGNRNLVAERLGISRATVYRKLKRYELH
ncbi:helix-turn-helix domain-containing protein [Arthrobacter sp. UCD-GKA]|uniref:sigma-54-dependent Fis family transcriptional regulator n=1 Tax=Arthrobacter sp. UCD-GKA TaxID=1913576 RepID=UPI000B17E5E0|nr:helix-turn-helix domain-containing protein [Arthrobacter sp. UCD-GKA]